MLPVIIYLAFISLGLPDSVLGVSWPAMRVTLGSPLEAAGFVTMVLTTSSVVSSVLCGPANRRFGTGRVVVVSCVLCSAFKSCRRSSRPSWQFYS